MLLYLNFEVLSDTLLQVSAANFHEVLSECLCITFWLNRHCEDTITFVVVIDVLKHMLVFGDLWREQIIITKLNIEIALEGASKWIIWIHFNHVLQRIGHIIITDLAALKILYSLALNHHVFCSSEPAPHSHDILLFPALAL